MKVTREKRTIFIKEQTNADFDRRLNESLKDLVNPEVQIYGMFECAILYDEITYEEEQKTIADLFEEAGCGKKCADCPFFEKSEDQRRKWHKCTLKDRKTRADSRACDSYYLRKEGKSEVPKVKRRDEEERYEDRRRSQEPEDHSSITLQPIEWADRVPAVGDGIPLAVLQSSVGRFIQGGVGR